MDIYGIITTVLTLFFGGGWFIYYKANKRIKEGEATQSEAEGWAKQQHVYQTTIEDQQKIYEHLKADFNVVVEENSKLRQENNELREKVNDLENQMLDMKREISRLGRRLEDITKEEKEQKKRTA
jgi:regulator of replication initiation timing